jgi:hypothetical protein
MNHSSDPTSAQQPDIFQQPLRTVGELIQELTHPATHRYPTLRQPVQLQLWPENGKLGYIGTYLSSPDCHFSAKCCKAGGQRRIASLMPLARLKSSRGVRNVKRYILEDFGDAEVASQIAQ